MSDQDGGSSDVDNGDGGGNNERLIEAHAATGRTVNRLTLSLLGVGTALLLTSTFPDSYLLTTTTTVSIPLAGSASFMTLLIVGPIVLIALRAYLEIYVAHWRSQENELAASGKMPDALEDVIFPMRDTKLSGYVWCVLYPFIPAVLCVLTYKALVLRELGVALFGVTVITTAVLLCRMLSRSWIFVLTVPPVVLAAVFGAVDWVYEHPFPRDQKVASPSSKSQVGESPSSSNKNDKKDKTSSNGEDDGSPPPNKKDKIWSVFEALRRPFDLTLVDLQRADLREKDLKGADLWGGQLDNALLGRAQLERAILFRATLIEANLGGANLNHADLEWAKLRLANLQVAMLNQSCLEGAELNGAYMVGAELRSADLNRVNFQGALLRGADLTGANLSRVNLIGTDLTNVKGLGNPIDVKALKGFKAVLCKTKTAEDEVENEGCNVENAMKEWEESIDDESYQTDKQHDPRSLNLCCQKRPMAEPKEQASDEEEQGANDEEQEPPKEPPRSRTTRRGDLMRGMQKMVAQARVTCF